MKSRNCSGFFVWLTELELEIYANNNLKYIVFVRCVRNICKIIEFHAIEKIKHADGTVTILMDSKQIANGSTTLSDGAGGAMQLTRPWIENVLNKLDPTSSAYQAVQTALKDGTLVKGVAGVDRATGQVTIVRVK